MRIRSNALVVASVAAAVGLAGGVLTAAVQTNLADSPPGAPGLDVDSLSDNVVYYAAKDIHQGDEARGHSPVGNIWDLIAVPQGWLLLENDPDHRRRLVLVRSGGGTIGFEVGAIPTIDVSTDGKQVVYPYGANKVIMRDLATLDVVNRLFVRERPVSAEFAGSDVVVTTERGEFRNVSKWDVDTGKLEDLRPSAEGSAVAANGQLMVARSYGELGPGCPSAIATDRPSPALWTECGLAVFKGSRGMSTDSRHVLMVDAQAVGQAPTTSWISVRDMSNGEEVGRIQERLITDASWLDDEHILVETADGPQLRSFTLRACSIEGACSPVVEVPNDYVVLGRQP